MVVWAQPLSVSMIPFSLIFLLVQSIAYVNAHGFVHQVIIDGRAYLGNPPNTLTASSPSIIRRIVDEGPVKGSSNKDLNCGLSAAKAQLVASANPGSQIQFDWRDANLANWPHNTGPMLTYMTSCGSITCDQYDSSNSGWFKIQQVGKKDNGTWYQEDIMQGQTALVTLPSNLAPGNYIIRHEIIALQLAQSEGGAEFYPSCTQLKVGGEQTGAPEPDELVLLPGAYKDTDPGIWDPDVYDPGDPYNQEKMPGPPIAQFVQNANGSSSGTSTTGPSSPTSTPPPQCRLISASSLSSSTLTKRALHRRYTEHSIWDMIKISISALR